MAQKEPKMLGPDKYVSLVRQAKQQNLDISLIADIQRKRNLKSGEELRNQLFWAGDGCGYKLNEGDVVFLHTDVDNNPGIQKLDDFVEQITQTDNFFLNPESFGLVEVDAEFNLSEFERQGVLQMYSAEFGYLEVKTSVLAEGRRVFRKEYGDGAVNVFDIIQGSSVYGKNGLGAKLKQKGNCTTRMYFLKPSYVKEELFGKDEGTTLWRSAFVYSFYYYPFVSLGGRGLSTGYVSLFGVVDKSAVVGGVIENSEELTHEKVLDYLKRNPVRDENLARALLDEVNKFY